MQLVEKIMREQFKMRSIKYRMFFVGLLLEKYIFKLDNLKHPDKRGTLLRNYYFLMRYLDDIIDGDVMIEKNRTIEARIEYLKEKLDNITNLHGQPDDVDQMIIECHALANQLGFSMEEESKYIRQSLIFAGYRMLDWDQEEKLKIVSADELKEHFYDLDILGTISGCLKIYDEDLSHLETLYPLGVACRQYYDIRDFMEDVKRGLINISKEDMEKYSISANDLFELMSLPEESIDICKDRGYNSLKLVPYLPESVITYLDNRIEQCEINLQKYHNKMENQSYPVLRKSTVMTLNLGYEKGAKTYIKQLKRNLYKKTNS